MGDVYKFDGGSNFVSREPEAALRHGGGDGTIGDMEARVAKLEAVAEKTGERLAAIDLRLAKLETRIDEGLRAFATKADVAEAKNSVIMWVVSAILLAQVLPAVLKKLGL